MSHEPFTVSNGRKATTGFGKWMQERVISRWENNIYALVFWGAMFLVFIVGLRGLGKDVNKIDVPLVGNLFKKAMIDTTTGRVSEDWVFWALVIESIMLLFMGLMLWFKPEENRKAQNGQASSTTPNEENLEIYIRGPKSHVIKSLTELQELVSKNK